MERKLKKKPSNNKTRTMFKMQKAGYFHMIHPSKLRPNFQTWITKDSPKIRWRRLSQFFSRASLPTMGLSPSHIYVIELKNWRWYNVELLLQKQVLGCLAGKFIYFKNATPTNSWWRIIRCEIRDRFVDMDKTRFYTPRQKVQRYPNLPVEDPIKDYRHLFGPKCVFDGAQFKDIITAITLLCQTKSKDGNSWVTNL